MLFFTCALWLFATLFVLNLDKDSDRQTVLTLPGQTETHTTTPVRQQSTPANMPIRAMLVEAQQQKSKSIWFATGDAALPVTLWLSSENHSGQPCHSHFAQLFSAGIASARARAPPAFA